MIITEKQEHILKLKKQMMSNTEIGRVVGVSGSRVHELHIEAQEATSAYNQWCYGLRKKTSNVLERYLLSQEECRDRKEWDIGWIKDYLWNQSETGLLGSKTIGFGEVTRAEILLWVEK